MQFYVYIVECNDGTYYIGKTSDLRKRLLKHNKKLPGGAKYTRTRNPVILVYYEQYILHKFAMQREFRLKQFSRKKKEELVNGFTACFLDFNSYS